VNLTYLGNASESSEIDVALIGKGVCFDAGGLNIKPTGYMETMYMDKCGNNYFLLNYSTKIN
jgi:leucyl aminopeptidase